MAYILIQSVVKPLNKIELFSEKHLKRVEIPSCHKCDMRVFFNKVLWDIYWF